MPVFSSEIAYAKELTEQFDSIKVYNKFKCTNNWLGVLGELVFHKYLELQNIKHEWIKPIKKTWTKPDFIINGKTIDIKTTYSEDLWFQDVKWDYYILAHYSENPTELYYLGYAYKDYLSNYINNEPTVVSREGRKDYVINYTELSNFGQFIEDVKKWQDQ